ncbi:hypothetical protein NKR23_g7188 [Pleurostoma richardsiae]|uniref:Uncharacterized protein n=1 Tax=Pleurostoma richardsiae TaxID=41990 RepID=A0AA38VH23_9PEZI|nr:hypothetical protein NKR23_g7188 [Pleurostoma richardsiae]
MSRLSPLPRSHSRASEAASVTTYYSFQDAEFDPSDAPIAASQAAEPYVDPDPSTVSPGSEEEKAEWRATSLRMRRQNSVYEASRASQSHQCSIKSKAHTPLPIPARPRKRPSARRTAKCVPVAYTAGWASVKPALSLAQSPTPHVHSTFFHFPNPGPLSGRCTDGCIFAVGMPPYLDISDPESDYQYDGHPRPLAQAAACPVPPPTTHYWTSDRTRRLEYAAIDAAGRGVRGWVMKHIVPECFVPKERRRMGFEDDRGSVRRYRIDLECEEAGEKGGALAGARGRKAWWEVMKKSNVHA